MSENMKKFLEMVSKDENLKQKAMAYNDMETDKAIQAGIALAKELGIELTEADFVKKESSNELNDDELDAVAGGGGCGCAAAGGGGGTNPQGETYGCACVMYGQGGNGNDDSFNCLCILGGAGGDEE